MYIIKIYTTEYNKVAAFYGKSRNLLESADEWTIRHHGKIIRDENNKITHVQFDNDEDVVAFKLKMDT